MTAKFFNLRGCAGLGAVAFLSGVACLPVSDATAGSLDLGNGFNADYSVKLKYGVGVRVEKQNQRIVGTNATTYATGLPVGVNADDGDRNFKQWDLINNRASFLADVDLNKGDYGVFLRASGFYDDVYRGKTRDYTHQENDWNNGDKFANKARHIAGRDVNMLDYYAYGTFYPSNNTMLNLRAGSHLVQWGESMFFANLAGTQSPADATKANVPGAEVKDILLPVGQVSAQLSIGTDLSLVGYMQYEYDDTDVDVPGTYFSQADAFGAGAARAFYFNFGGTYLAMPVKNEKDPDGMGQWGIGARYRITPETELGVYHVQYHDKIGLANTSFNVTTPTALTYSHRKNNSVQAVTVSTRVGDTQVSGEVTYKHNAQMYVATTFGPQGTVGKAVQGNISAIHTLGPNMLSDGLALVGEFTQFRNFSPKAYTYGGTAAIAGQSFNAINIAATNTKTGNALQVGATLDYFNVMPGWDMQVPIFFGYAPQGKSASGQQGALTGKGDGRLSLGTTFKYLGDLELSANYVMYLNSADLAYRPLADRDYVSASISYTF